MRSLFLAAGVWFVAAVALVGFSPSADTCLVPALRLPAAQAAYLRTFQQLSADPSVTSRYDAVIVREARRRGLDPRLMKAVIAAESGFYAHARSPRGARGLMQVMPATAAEMGFKDAARLYEPEVNIAVGAAYLALLHRAARVRYREQLAGAPSEPAWLRERIVAAYNAGPKALSGRRWCTQTRLYVEKVQFYYRTDVAAVRLAEPLATASAR